MNFLFFQDKKKCCGYSLEAPRRGASNEYHNICFRRELRKKYQYFLVTECALSEALLLFVCIRLLQ